VMGRWIFYAMDLGCALLFMATAINSVFHMVFWPEVAPDGQTLWMGLAMAFSGAAVRHAQNLTKHVAGDPE
jgi:RsiW-degrading membrane proteinase PrsW (M82 family)